MSAVYSLSSHKCACRRRTKAQKDGQFSNALQSSGLFIMTLAFCQKRWNCFVRVELISFK